MVCVGGGGYDCSNFCDCNMHDFCVRLGGLLRK